jgi:hypothetical protein
MQFSLEELLMRLRRERKNKLMKREKEKHETIVSFFSRLTFDISRKLNNIIGDERSVATEVQ